MNYSVDIVIRALFFSTVNAQLDMTCLENRCHLCTQTLTYFGWKKRAKRKQKLQKHGMTAVWQTWLVDQDKMKDAHTIRVSHWIHFLHTVLCYELNVKWKSHFLHLSTLNNEKVKTSNFLTAFPIQNLRAGLDTVPTMIGSWSVFSLIFHVS